MYVIKNIFLKEKEFLKILHFYEESCDHGYTALLFHPFYVFLIYLEWWVQLNAQSIFSTNSPALFHILDKCD